MQIKVSTENRHVPITIIHVDGNLDSAAYKAFQGEIEGLIKNGARYILIDLAHSPFVSSAGFRAFNHIFRELNAIQSDSSLSEEDIKKGVSAGSYKSPYLKLVNLSNDTKVVLKTTGFDMFLECYDDLKEAIASF